MAKLSSHQSEVIQIANEMGYFPTPAQAKRISAESAVEYSSRYNGRPPKGPCDLGVVRECDETAIRRVMEGRVSADETIEGVADAEMIQRVAVAVERRVGASIRIQIREI